MTHGRADLVGRLWYWVALLASALLFALNGTAAKASSISEQGPVRQGFRSSTFVLPSPGTDCVRRCVGVGRVTLTKEHFEAAGSPAGSVALLVREEVQSQADGLLQRFTKTGAPALRTHVTQRPPNASGRQAPESETTHDYDAGSHVTTSLEFVATETGGTGETAKPRDPVTDLPRDANGNIIGGVGGGRGKALSDAEAEAVRDFEAGLSPDQKLLNSAKDKLKGQEKYQGTRNKQKRGK